MTTNRNILPTFTLLEALKRMEVLDKKLLIIEDKGKFIGLLSIGDIQRAIIHNKPLDTRVSDVLRKSIRIARPEDTFDRIKQMMVEFRMELCPVVNDQNEIVKIYFWEEIFGERKPKPISARKPAPKKKTLSAKGYKRPAFDLETSGTYIFKTPKKDYIVKSYLFERENDIEDSLQIQNELRAELGAIIIKNSAWRNLANGKTIQARASKGQKGKLTKLK